MHLRILSLFSAAALCLGLSACDVSMPSQLETGHMRLAEETRSIRLDAERPDVAVAHRIVEEFRENGRGDIRLVMPYRGGDPLSETRARHSGGQWQAAFAKAGTAALKIDYVDVADPALLGQAVVSYRVLAALPPANCGQRLTGHQGGDTLEDMHSYRIGCETRMAISKMIVNAEDLKGRDGSAEGDSRRQGTVAERYMSGERMETLQTTSASSIGR
jgi:type IV pilus biogenesis protein CpaD/CtpE